MQKSQPEKSAKMPAKLSSPAQNSYAMLARDRKAMALMNLLIFAKITAADAEGASESDWLLAAKAAGVKPPSKTTQEMVIAMLRERETTG